MSRFLVSFVASLALPIAYVAAEPPEPTETVVRMTVQPMPAPKPALKYQLLPELSEMNPGNPIQGYMWCFAEEYNFFHLQEAVDQREKWLAMPLKDLPVEKVLVSIGGPPQNADFAARLDRPDWQVLLRLKRDGANTLLPDVQQVRSLAEILKLRLRAQAAGGRFDDAVTGAKTMFAMSRHMGENPTGVAALVGYAIADLALDPLEEMNQQPGCPNLYWALTDLPSPLIDLHNANSNQRDMFALDFALLDDAAPMTAAQVKMAIERFTQPLRWHRAGDQRTSGEFQAAATGFRDRLNKMAHDEAAVDAARTRLLDSGSAAETVKKFPSLQVILLDEKRKYENLRDDVLKFLQLPYWQVEPALIASQKKAEDDAESIFSSMAPRWGWPTIQFAVLREQRIALLRCVEALRLYAADHDGKLPAALDDVPVPVPVDPVTGKSFSYKLDGATAILHGTPPRGKEKEAAFNRRYEVTIKK